ncbi:S1C family serine protease [Verticiella sediminum]|uniref:S1C family serine protease n=1 Tax=Verticiella sediminum TaxID=1247510 RepID=UPI0014784414|nr:S1C family serine protease [Verticiella sediminum]
MSAFVPRPHTRGTSWLSLLAGLGACVALASASAAQTENPPGVAPMPAQPPLTVPPGEGGPQPIPQQARLEIADFSVVELRGTAAPNARVTSLGDKRQGGGIVIDDEGLILTIGYLVIETEQIEVIGRNGQRVPAALIAYDNNTGLGLVRAAAPLNIEPIDFADSSQAKVSDPMLVVGFDGVAPAYLVSRRQYAGTWEYLLDDALFTAPATTGWSGAALVNNEGKLVGIGSLLVPDALGESQRLAGNMFVPVDLLKPILTDLVEAGKPKAPARPWLGVNVQDIKGRLLVTRVSADGPAARGGINEGDIIVGLKGQPLKSSADFYQRLWESGDAGVEVELNVVQGAEVKRLPIKTIDRQEYLRPPAMF